MKSHTLDNNKYLNSYLSPSVILVMPQLSENIGMVARAMLNCGLDDLRLVSPKDKKITQTQINVTDKILITPIIL